MSNKIIQIALLLLFMTNSIIAQNAISIEIIPYAKISQSGNGIQVSYQRQFKSRWFAAVKYGILYDLIDQSGYTSPKSGGIPVGKYSTEVEIYNSQTSHKFLLPDQSIIDDLNRLGIKQVKPYKSQRLDNFGSINLGFVFKESKKWTFSGTAGVLLGVANRIEYGGALTSNLGDNPFIGSTAPSGWIVFQVYSRYWYTGLSNSLNIDRKLNDKLALGLSLGSNFIVDNSFRTDILILYAGLSLKVGF